MIACKTAIPKQEDYVMRWKTLIPASLISAGLSVLLLVFTLPAGAQAPLEACGMVRGDACESICMRECGDGSCCHWRHYNYK